MRGFAHVAYPSPTLPAQKPENRPQRLSTMSLVLDAAQLSRIFGTGERAFTAVDRVSLRISSGEIHALLGPNGAGKTTTVQMCSTLLTPTSGTLTVNGINAIAHPQRARRHVGLALGGDSGFYPRASARDNLLFFADIAGVSGCLLYTSPSPRDQRGSRMPSSA